MLLHTIATLENLAIALYRSFCNFFLQWPDQILHDGKFNAFIILCIYLLFNYSLYHNSLMFVVTWPTWVLPLFFKAAKSAEEATILIIADSLDFCLESRIFFLLEKMISFCKIRFFLLLENRISFLESRIFLFCERRLFHLEKDFMFRR